MRRRYAEHLAALTGKVAIVSGAARGIGRTIAVELAREGARVVVNYAHSAEPAEAVAKELGGLAAQADVARVEEISTLFDAAERAFGVVDLLVNNAGVAIFGPAADATEDDFDRTFAVNARGTFFCCREAARRMRADGRIFSISTGATVGGTTGGAAYCGSKAAVEQFTRALARELGGRGITIKTISPGFTETDMLAQFPQLVEAAPGMSVVCQPVRFYSHMICPHQLMEPDAPLLLAKAGPPFPRPSRRGFPLPGSGAPSAV